MDKILEKQKAETKVESLPVKQAGLITLMAAKYSMEPAAYAAAVKKTAMPSNATNEEFAAFLMVAKEYNLNPLLKEIYAFPKKGGGIMPMVSVDGWINIVNSRPELNGFEIENHYDDKKALIACTCRMWRKDRDRPTVVTEYLAEVYRATDPWKMKHRMLRHKAFIQAARYCFGLSGIMDEDEALDASGMRDITPAARPERSEFIAPAADATINQETGEVTEGTDYGVPEAYEDGSNARAAGNARDAYPAMIRDRPELVEAFADGWDAEDEHHKEQKK